VGKQVQEKVTQWLGMVLIEVKLQYFIYFIFFLCLKKGIVPICCEQIFERINANTNPNITYEVQFSMLEIYCEKIQDLLIPT